MANENDFSMSENITLPDFNILSFQRLIALLDTTTSPASEISI
jgi:hypothetical protein